MEIDSIPVLGRINKTVSAIVVNFVLLGIVAVVLGVTIPFFPQILDVLVGALLLVTAAIFFSIAYHIRSYQKKYTDWFDK